MSEPTLPELNQDEPGPTIIETPVKVVIEGPVKTQDMPAVIGTARRVSLPDTNDAVVIGNEDYGRKRLLLLSPDGPFIFGLDRGQVMSGFGPEWPENVILEITARNQVWAKTGTADTGMTLTVVEEFWAD